MTRRLLAYLLLAVSLAQAADLPGFARVVGGYRLGPGVPIAVAVVVVEVIAGAALLDRARPARRAGAWLALVAAAGWTGAGVAALARDLDLRNAGWLGTWAVQPLTAVALAVPAVVALLAWRVLRRGRRTRLRW